MPLSEHEQRLLEQMERALYAEDPKFVSSLQHPTQRSGSRRRLIIGFLLGLAGMALLVTGVATKLAPLGVVGFIVMLGGVVIALTGGRARASDDESGTAEAPAKPTNSGSGSGNSDGSTHDRHSGGSGGGFMDRMEDRWRNRREEEQG